MSRSCALPPPPTVEDTMHDMALTSYRRPESAFDFDGWNRCQRTVLQLMAHKPSTAIITPSTDSDLDHIIHSTTAQSRLLGSQRKGKTPFRSTYPCQIHSYHCSHNYDYNACSKTKKQSSRTYKG